MFNVSDQLIPGIDGDNSSPKTSINHCESKKTRENGVVNNFPFVLKWKKNMITFKNKMILRNFNHIKIKLVK